MELIGGGHARLVAPLSSVVDSFLDQVGSQVVVVSEADLVAEARELEVEQRRMDAARLLLVAEMDRRGVAGTLAVASTAQLLQGLLRISPGEAKRRVGLARACGPRVTVTGERLEPERPHVAAAMADGVLSAEQAQVIVKTLGSFPDTLSVTQLETAELTLVDAAKTLAPAQLVKAADRYLAYLCPDGVLAEPEYQAKVRELSLTQRADGTFDLHGRLTGTCGAQLVAALTPRAAPEPATNGQLDPRTYGQRMHDGLEDLAGISVRRNELTNAGGLAQVIITMTEEQYLRRRGVVETSVGHRLTVGQALTLADEAVLYGLVHAANGEILKLGTPRRLASRQQTVALIGRDKGCSFPDCDKPPEMCQRHHIIDWAHGGPTNIDNLTLLCRFHHREYDQLGWTCHIKDGLPWWTPPPWTDPHQTPLLNHRIQQGLAPTI